MVGWDGMIWDDGMGWIMSWMRPKRHGIIINKDLPKVGSLSKEALFP